MRVENGVCNAKALCSSCRTAAGPYPQSRCCAQQVMVWKFMQDRLRAMPKEGAAAQERESKHNEQHQNGYSTGTKPRLPQNECHPCNLSSKYRVAWLAHLGAPTCVTTQAPPAPQ